MMSLKGVVCDVTNYIKHHPGAMYAQTRHNAGSLFV
jgi:hypothetical protein